MGQGERFCWPIKTGRLLATHAAAVLRRYLGEVLCPVVEAADLYASLASFESQRFKWTLDTRCHTMKHGQKTKKPKKAENTKRQVYMQENPFTPEFGIVPDVLAGRESMLGAMKLALGASRRSPDLTTLFIGARGTGKTVLLSCVREEASRNGWVVTSATALPGMLEELYEQARYNSEHLLSNAQERHMTSLALGPVSAGWERGKPEREGWRMRMTRLIDGLAQTGTGLLITVDEVQGDLDELVRLVATYQQFVTDGKRVSLVMAGLPYHIHQLLANRSVSFLRRASQRSVGRISDQDVSFALRVTAEGAGKSFDDDALGMCVRASEGFAYMIQLVGYRSWMESADRETITELDALRGIEAARADITDRILLQTYRELSEGDLRFLEAMLTDREDSRVSDIARRMGVTTGYAATYKKRLLASGVIGERRRGVVGFEIPRLREFLEDRA